MMNTMLGNINRIILIYLLFINLVALCLMWLDKRKARLKQYRISENTLLSIAFIGGIVGIGLGMLLFRHKTRKIKFVLGLPLIFIIQIVMMYKLK